MKLWLRKREVTEAYSVIKGTADYNLWDKQA